MKAFNDYVFLKKYYGENFAKFCRENFPTILEEPGRQSNIITQKFAKERNLYDDIVNNKYETDFINFIYSYFDAKENLVESNLSPFELMEKAGYKLYECKSVADIISFIKYWDTNELLCTFKNIRHRLEKRIVFFAVKEGADKLNREDFTVPQREDEYGTSVISIQFDKINPHIFVILNRYNHSVNNPDATFSNNLDNIVTGLTKSFGNYLKEYYSVNFD